jgi:hypothetical protein
MRRLRLALPLALGLLLLAVAPSPLPAQTVWQATFSAAPPLEHENLESLFVPEKPALLGGKPLFDPKQPARSLRNPRGAVVRKGMVVELANGDRLPGQIVAHLPAEDEKPERFIVSIDNLSPAGEAILEPAQWTVRASQLRRCLPADATDHQLQPGRVILRDGRRWQARSIRFQAGAANLLTTQGIVSVPLGEIVRLDMPNVDIAEALAAETIWSAEPSAIVRAQLTNGAEISFAQPLAQGGDHGWIHLRPVWSPEAVRMQRRGVASFTFRDADEVPLSLLPAEEKRTGALPGGAFQRNQTVDGGRLQLGAASDALGLTQHAPSELTVTLPAGARSFTALVGVMHGAGAGCVKCRVHKDGVDGDKLWESDFLRGGMEPVAVEIGDLKGAEKLVLVADMAHHGRPAGADPLDIRDDVVWLRPMVRLNRDTLPAAQRFLKHWVPAVSEWELAEGHGERLALRPAWDRSRELCLAGITAAKEGSEPFVFELRRRVKVSPHNARFTVQAARDSYLKGKYAHELEVCVDGGSHSSTMNGDVKTISASMTRFDYREYNLGEFLGKEIDGAGNVQRERPGRYVWAADRAVVVVAAD